MTPETLWIVSCFVLRVIDADTFVCKRDDGAHSIRLHSVNAPEVGTPEGDAARDWAEIEWKWQYVTCAVHGASLGRLVATCWVRGPNLARDAVEEGHAIDVCGLYDPPGTNPNARYCR